MSALRIFYLEDNPDDVALAQHAARHYGQACEWVVAANAAEFRAALPSNGYDLILLDSQVPGLDGEAAFQASRAAWPNIPIVLISGGRLAPRAAAAHLQAGAADQLSKDELWRLVPLFQRALERRAQQALACQARGRTRLVAVVQELSMARSLEQIQEIVRHAARDLTGADGATFILKDGDQCYYVDEDAIAPLWKGLRFPLTACVSGWAMLNRQQAVIEDIYTDERVPVDAYRATFVKSMAMVPIRPKAPIGAIGNYWASRHQATPDELALLQALADTTAVAIENVQLYEELECRVRERTAQLQEANQELEAYAYTVSHDLRAPLRVIDGFSEILIEEAGDSLNEAGRDAVQRMQTAAQRAKTMVEDLLHLSRLNRVAVRPVAVDLSLMAQEVAADCQAAWPDRPVEMVIAPGLNTYGDRGLLRVLLQNLIGNAWKYSSRQPTPRVEFGATTAPDGGTAYVVRDNGVGFDMAYADKLFAPFQRLHAPEDFPGTGVGLATAQRIVARHRGEIWAESAPGNGAAFYFTLPRLTKSE